ncbi:Rha family transcriptional regulator [Undibacterium crateris]|uniref:Rha family transcriptional regulator n=1 Tax=Undibacterium crateris TaxID=2528175 RepID=UPI00138A1B79|nr:Rha family transcriptional regulator [Undibacterium crateris]NDI85062.1 hypothetical protein [Undibacterium crateris]
MSNSTSSAALATSIVSITNDRAVTSSNLIAEKFGKRHADVLRAISKLECSSEFTERNFALSEFYDSTGRKLPCYVIARDGFMFLAMGFTGKDAAKWKEAYIDAFNKMEEELARISGQSRAPYSVNSHDVLSADQAEEIRMTLKATCDHLPKDKQATFMVKGWSRLKSHFGVNYREIPKAEYSEALSLITRYAAEWELLESPAISPVEQKKYSYPKEMLMQPHFCGTREDGSLKLPKLDLRTFANARFSSSIAKLLEEMHQDGHNVDAPYIEFMAIQSGVKILDSQVGALSLIGTSAGNEALKMLFRQTT